MRVSIALLLVLTACAAQSGNDVQVPDFARQPYEAFSRSAAIAIAEREWRVFGSPVNDDPPGQSVLEDEQGSEKPERMQGLWQRVGEYWWLGMPDGLPEQKWTGEHDAQGQVFPALEDGRYAWSAAFISYVMRIAGAGKRFPYSASHSDYINIAATGSSAYDLAAQDPTRYAPAVGDLICLARASARGMQFSDLPASGDFPSHCDIVVDAASGLLTVIGGNVHDAVTMKHVPTTEDGLIADADGTPVDTRYQWFVVIQVQYAAE